MTDLHMNFNLRSIDRIENSDEITEKTIVRTEYQIDGNDDN